MVKKVFKFFAYLLFFIFALILFAPKSSLYFLLEENLKKFDVIISDETVADTFLTLKVKNLDVSTKGIESAKIEEVDMSMFLLFNTVEFHSIKLSSLVDSFLPADIEHVKISYTLFNPLVISAEGIGKFGEVSVNVNLLHRELKLFLRPSKKMLRSYQNSLRIFIKDAKGEYSYAKTF